MIICHQPMIGYDRIKLSIFMATSPEIHGLQIVKGRKEGNGTHRGIKINEALLIIILIADFTLYYLLDKRINKDTLNLFESSPDARMQLRCMCHVQLRHKGRCAARAEVYMSHNILELDEQHISWYIKANMIAYPHPS